MYQINNIPGQAVVGKPRHVDKDGNRVPFDETLVSDKFRKADMVSETDAVFESDKAQDCAVTLKPHQGDPSIQTGGHIVEVVGKQINFTGELWLQVLQTDEVVYLHKLTLADFEDVNPDGSRNFVTKQINLGFALLQGANVDIRLEKVAGATTGAFRCKALRFKGDLEVATDVETNNRGHLVDTAGNVVPEGPILDEDLPDDYEGGKGIHDDWQRVEPGKYIQVYSGVPDIDRFSPEILQSA